MGGDVAAEKFPTMVTLRWADIRMKDFYEIRILGRSFDSAMPDRRE
jgi:hypothetical protein